MRTQAVFSTLSIFLSSSLFLLACASLSDANPIPIPSPIGESPTLIDNSTIKPINGSLDSRTTKSFSRHYLPIPRDDGFKQRREFGKKGGLKVRDDNNSTSSSTDASSIPSSIETLSSSTSSQSPTASQTANPGATSTSTPGTSTGANSTSSATSSKGHHRSSTLSTSSKTSTITSAASTSTSKGYFIDQKSMDGNDLLFHIESLRDMGPDGQSSLFAAYSWNISQAQVTLSDYRYEQDKWQSAANAIASMEGHPVTSTKAGN